jgi:hypothetical protein
MPEVHVAAVCVPPLEHRLMSHVLPSSWHEHIEPFAGGLVGQVGALHGG